MTEHTSTNDTDAHDLRRHLISEGAACSLVAFDPARGLFVFDATEVDPESLPEGIPTGDYLDRITDAPPILAGGDAPARKAHTTHVMHLRANYIERDVQATITSGRGGLSLGLSYAHGIGAAVGTNLTPAQAREMAAELIARADEIDALTAAAGE